MGNLLNNVADVKSYFRPDDSKIDDRTKMQQKALFNEKKLKGASVKAVLIIYKRKCIWLWAPAFRL